MRPTEGLGGISDAASKSWRGVREVWAKPHTGRVAPEVIEVARDPELQTAIREDPELHASYIRRFQEGEPGVDRVLVKVNQGLIKSAINRYRSRDTAEKSDWAQEARLGLLEACARYDFRAGVKPATWIGPIVQAYVRHSIIQHGSCVRAPTHAYTPSRNPGPYRPRVGQQIATPFSSLRSRDYDPSTEYDFQDRLIDDRPAAEEELGEMEIEDAIPYIARRLLRKLPLKHWLIVMERFWGEETFNDIGDRLGYSRERIRQLENTALEGMRTEARRLGGRTPSWGQHASFTTWLAALADGIAREARERGTLQT